MAFSWFWRWIGARRSAEPPTGSPVYGRTRFRDGSGRMLQRDLFPLTYTLLGIDQKSPAIIENRWSCRAGFRLAAKMLELL